MYKIFKLSSILICLNLLTYNIVFSQTSHRPNILFAISDDQSHVHTSYNGSTFIQTPAFDEIAKEGIYFSNCIAGSPGCAPSRSSLITGRYPWQNEQSGQHASSWMKKYVPFVDLLEKNGYFTGYTGKGVEPFQYARNANDSLWRKGNAAGKMYNSIRYKLGDSSDIRPAKGISNIDYFSNFKDFLSKKNNNQPFFFWYGAHEPHRNFEKDAWIRNGKKLKDVSIPKFLPDDSIVRGDLLDYAIEIEWFDHHLQKMLEYLKQIGELDNTIVIVTSDNGMSFPRAKANDYEFGIHVPFAVRYPKMFAKGKVIDQPISFVDIAPTILEITNTSSQGMQSITGKSFLTMLKSGKDDPSSHQQNDYVYSSRERHSSSRYLNWGYPQRAIRNKDFLLIWNMKPDRWPAGDPQALNPKNNQLFPLYGIDKNGKHHPEWAFTDIDASPTKSFIIENHLHQKIQPYFQWATMKRPEYELYNIQSDPDCLINLYDNAQYKVIQNKLKVALLNELQKTKDPRVVGPNNDIFDTYERYSGGMRQFPKP